MRYLFLLSVTLNLLLLATLVAARVDPGRATDDSGAIATTFVVDSIADDPDGGSATASDVWRRLQAAGFAADEARALLLGWVEQHFRVRWRNQEPGYWQAGFGPARINSAFELAVGNSVRRTLTGLFGTDAGKAPEFSEAFLPLGPAFDFLGSDGQIALQHFQLEKLAAGSGSVSQLPTFVCADLLRHDRTRPPTDQLSELESLLTATGFADYQLRFSSAAEALRSSGATLEEADFRQAFGLIQSLERASDPLSQLDSRQALRRLLGDQAFDRFWSGRDPIYQSVHDYLQQKGLSQAEIDTAYAEINHGQEDMLRLASSRSSPADIARAAGEMQRHQATSLERLLGREIAAGLLAAMLQRSIELSRSLRETC